ncbi:MAG: DUF917 domain-containing protein [Desulfitobacterium hafniense]|nr:DUF917 domain-containing protein [Desulfitobacterium hafniense]
MQVINKEWIQPLMWGNMFLSSGGGGGERNIAKLLEKTFRQSLEVNLIELNEIDPAGQYLAVGIMGSPELLEEHYITGFEGVDLFDQLNNLRNNSIQGLFPVEAASVNILYPLLVAGLSKRPLINGDAMGRAFPEFQMTTFHLNNLPSTPFVLKDCLGNNYHFHDEDTFLLELNTRQVVDMGGGVGFFAGYPTAGNILKRILIPKTISFAANIGRTFLESKSYPELLNDLIVASKNSLYASVIELFVGTVETSNHIRTKTLEWDTIAIKGKGYYEEEEFKILVKNENLIAYRNNQVAAMVPDLISIIDLETLKPVGNSNLTAGAEVAVIGMPAPLVLKTKKSLEFIGPQNFGYKSKYKSLEELYFSYYFGD